jgi:hypothetical protein
MLLTRTATAASLGLIATICVILMMNGQPDMAKESTDAMHEYLTSNERQAAADAGDQAEDAEIKEDEDAGDTGEDIVQAEKDQEKKDAKKAKRFHNGEGKTGKGVYNEFELEAAAHRYGSNCLTLKAYALGLESDDDLCTACGSSSCGSDNPGQRALNELSRILSKLRKHPEKYNDYDSCTGRLDQIFEELETAHDLHDDDESIGSQMLATMKDSMKNKRGFLVWGQLLDRGGSCTCQHSEQRACMKHGLGKTDNQFVYVDAERVGFSGEPPIFSKLAIKSSKVMQIAEQMLKDSKHHTSHLSHELAKGEKKFSDKDFSVILKWQGNF